MLIRFFADRQGILVGDIVDGILVADRFRIRKQMLGSVCCLVPDLIGELGHDRLALIHAGERLAQLHRAVFDRGEIEAHVQVGGARAAFHVEDLHGMGRVVAEDPVALVILLEGFLQFRLGEVPCKNLIQGRMHAVDIDVAGTVVDRARRRAVDAAQVDDQLAVHIEPEVVVAGEFVDDVVAPCVQAARRLGKGGLDLYGKVAVDISDQIELFVLSRITVRQFAERRVIQIFPVDRGEDARLQIVEGEELSVLQRVLVAAGVIGAQFVVYDEIRASERRKILGAVKFIIAAAGVGACDKEVVDLGSAGIHAGKRGSGDDRRRIPVRVQRGCQQSLMESRAHAAVIVSDVSLHGRPVGKVLDPHGNAILGVVHRRHCCQCIVRRQILHNGEIEIFRRVDRAGDQRLCSGGQIRAESAVGVFAVIPGQDRGGVITVASAVQVDADGFVLEQLSAARLRGKVLVFVLVVQLIIEVGVVRSFPCVLGEVPEHRVELSSDPLDRVAALIAADKGAVMVDGVEFILFVRIIPGAGIDDDARAVRYVLRVGNAHLLGRVDPEVVLGKLGKVDEIEPFAAHAAAHAEAFGGLAAVGQRDAVHGQRDLAGVNPRSGNDPEQCGRIAQRQAGCADPEIFRAAVHRCAQGVEVVLHPRKAPQGDVAVVGNKELIPVVAPVGHDRQSFGIQGVGSGRACHHGLAGGRSVPAHQAEGFSVEAVGILGYGRLLFVPEGDLAAVIVFCVSRKTFSLCIALLVPVIPVGSNFPAAVCVRCDGKHGSVSLIRESQAVCGLLDIVTLVAVDLVCVLSHFFKEELRRALGRDGALRLCFQNAGARCVDVVGAVCKIVAVHEMANIQSIRAEAVKVRLGLDLRPVAGDRFRSLNDGVGGKARGREGNGVARRIGGQLLRLLAEVDHRIILPGVRTVQQFHLDVHSLVRLVFHSLAVDNGDIKDSGIGKAGGVQQDRGPAKIHLILLAAQLPGLQLRPGGDAAGPVVSNRNFISLAVGGVYGLL